MNKIKFLNGLNQKSSNFFGKLGTQKHLAVIRDAFALLMPLVIVGAVGILLRTFVFGGIGATQTSILGWIAKSQGQIVIDSQTKAWAFVEGSSFAQASIIGDRIFASLGAATIDLMSVYVAFGIGYFLSSVRHSKDHVFAGLVSLFAFFIVTFGKSFLLSANGLLSAIIVGIFATEIFVKLEKSERLAIKLPQGVPPAVARAFAKLLPLIILALIVSLLNVPFIIFGTYTPNSSPSANLFSFADALYYGIQAPFMSFVGQKEVSLALGFLWALAVSIIWFFGIHGSNVLMGIFTPIWYALYYENVNGASHVFVEPSISVFMQIGGTGATLALIIAIFIFSKNKATRQIGKIGLAPGIFNINEPIIFGLPIVLNVRYALPFIFCMPILAITTWMGFTFLKIHPATILVPWNTPVGIGGLLATELDYKGFLLAIFNFLVSFLIYFPFVLIGQKNKVKATKNKIAQQEVSNEI